MALLGVWLAVKRLAHFKMFTLLAHYTQLAICLGRSSLANDEAQSLPEVFVSALYAER
ncbi:hypothetical protein PGTUg99_016896 [Puccinia graminis f. sp. tritici]|uniref:Uncharacterized protein n=1 Tax=Puccinia graminis f. sp. tritici TaxID=56615 RepID=A0A5B0NDK0_PUCGR|nr:hypothetical protein PGTUg99_016896 [Puccinia graminis f. sp. tritici]